MLQILSESVCPGRRALRVKYVGGTSVMSLQICALALRDVKVGGLEQTVSGAIELYLVALTRVHCKCLTLVSHILGEKWPEDMRR